MGLYQSIIGSLEGFFRVGNSSTINPYYGFYNGFLTRLISNQTANRDLTLPDDSGTLALLKANGLEVKLLSYYSLPTTGLPNRAIVYCTDHPQGETLMVWNGNTWLNIFINSEHISSVYARLAGFSTIFSTTLDFGTNPVFSKLFNYSHPSAYVGQKVSITPSADMPVGIDLDELEMDSLSVSAYVSNPGVITALVTANPGPIIGQRKFNYQIV